ncbi:LuxR C-terminal-related transcriptional regulator [Streptomyces monticola]|uniref:LuxR C-terminal-related transcriptional regulator n=1 Tax=Streptomyces monticola TaxID=2666263 RepID=A0ABW2JVS5_9ACTN
MTVENAADGRVLLYEPERPDVYVLLADADPVSRHVLAGALGGADGIKVLGTADSGEPLHRWPLSGVDVVVLADASRAQPDPVAAELVHKGIRVLLLGTGWTGRSLGAALAAGCVGALVKDPEIGRLAAAVRAAAAGYVVVSPELVGLWTPQARPAAAAPRRERGDRSVGLLLRSLTEREREVLTLLADGLSTNETARRLKVTPATVKSHVSHALTKLSVRNRLEAVLLMRQALDGDRPPWS